jgi:protein-tyrosine-phosphatase
MQRISASIEILVVCTGNICRSPMAEALLRARLAARGLSAHVQSAGTLAWGGPATGSAALAMRELGLAIDGHLSRQLTDDLVMGADLVLGMTREHVWRVARAERDAQSRSFLVGELARLGPAAGARARDESVRTWAARVAALRPGGLVGRAGDEVEDPVGEPIGVYRATASRLDRDLERIASLLAP